MTALKPDDSYAEKKGSIPSKLSLERSDPNRWISSWTTSLLNPWLPVLHATLLPTSYKERSISGAAAPGEIPGEIPVMGGSAGEARQGRGRRGILVGPTVASRACADAQLDRLPPEHVTVALQSEHHVDRSTSQTSHTRAEAHELEQVRHPLGARCTTTTSHAQTTRVQGRF